jgi:hypothetical protein
MNNAFANYLNSMGVGWQVILELDKAIHLFGLLFILGLVVFSLQHKRNRDRV